MLSIAGKHFRACVEIFLWLNLISGVILGWKTLGASGSTGYSILGAILGFAVGIISNILIGGLISKILNIDENLEIIKDKSFGISEAGTPKTGNSSSEPLNLL